MFERPRDLRKYSPFQNYKLKQLPSQIEREKGFQIFMPEYENGR